MRMDQSEREMGRGWSQNLAVDQSKWAPGKGRGQSAGAKGAWPTFRDEPIRVGAGEGAELRFEGWTNQRGR